MEQEPLLLLDELQRLDLRSGDRFVLTTPRRLSDDDCARIARAWEQFCPGHKLIILDGGSKLTILSEAEV